MYPLNKSRTNVAVARNLFPVLRTFVVPIFPEPTSLMSFLINNEATGKFSSLKFLPDK